jgi:hypothetical protein
MQLRGWVGRAALALSLVAFVGGGAIVLWRSDLLRASGPARAVTASIIGVRVNDAVDLLEQIDENALPAGVEIQRERLGPEFQLTAHYLQLTPGPNESLQNVLSRLDSWLAQLRLPADTRLAWEPVESVHETTGAATITGWRSYFIRGEPFLTERDVRDVAVVESEDWYVRVRLRAEGIERLERVWSEMLKQRVALMANGLLVAAPLINVELTKDTIELYPAPGWDFQVSRGEAEHLLRRLTDTPPSLADSAGPVKTR